MLVHPQFDPVAVSVGPLAVRWYGLMYLIGFALIWAAGRYRIARTPEVVWTAKDLDDALFFGILGTIIGGRLGYVLFYKFADYAAEPWRILYVWEGGMSFHGGMLGVIVAMVWFAWRRRQDWLAITDFIAPLIPFALAAGRLGNFINAELWGRPAAVPWAMVFPNVDACRATPRSSTSLRWKASCCWWSCGGFRSGRDRAARSRARSCSATGCSASWSNSRASPTATSGLLALGLSMGQWLSAPMIIAGAAMIMWAYRSSTHEGVNRNL